MGDPIDPFDLPVAFGVMRPVPRADNDNEKAGRARAAPLPPAVAAAIALAGGRRAGLSLRLDPARHMRLRIACAIGGLSAQAIIRAALDAHLAAIPGIERLMAAATAEGGEHLAMGGGMER